MKIYNVNKNEKSGNEIWSIMIIILYGENMFNMKMEDIF